MSILKQDVACSLLCFCRLHCQRLELLARRSQRMRELYSEEAQLYAQELRALGLVVFNGELPPKVC
jgi:hypothetical protein